VPLRTTRKKALHLGINVLLVHPYCRNEYGEVSEAFKSKSLLNPYHQHVYLSLAHRALNEDSQLPLQSDFVTNLLKSPYETKSSYKLALDGVKKLFQLTEVKQKKNGKSAAAVFKK
jgi:hypothetical protein